MFRKITTKVATVAVALGALTSAALAEPINLTDAQMDESTAGTGSNSRIIVVDSSGILYYSPDGGKSYIDSKGRNWTSEELASHTGINVNQDFSVDPAKIKDLITQIIKIEQKFSIDIPHNLVQDLSIVQVLAK
jgi:hypothetical protein